ncbi:MAG: hypothetical protein M1835_005923 [Candelina submexicana]|nr:MAG: hypothetical protein M1835_005923 [Candelina submexicana]
MDVFYYYSYGTAAWLSVQALPLLVSPTMIVTMLSPDVRKPTSLEDYFCRSLGITLLALGVITILLTGSVPLTSTFAESASEGVSTEDSDPKSPYALPTLTLTTTYHAANAFYGYVAWMQIGSASFGLSTIGSGALAAVGLWCILFASSEGKISRKTGADKRTSGFPFGNKEADKKRQPGRKAL